MTPRFETVYRDRPAGGMRDDHVWSESMFSGRVPLHIELITTRQGFDSLEAQWNALFERAGRPTQVFQTYDWLRHWADVYLESPTTLAIVAGWRQGRLVMVWPLVASRHTGLMQVTWMGAPVSQYGDALVEDSPFAETDLAAGLDYVSGALRADVLSLRKVRADAVAAPILKQAGAVATAQMTAPYLDLASAPDFATFEQRYTAKARKNRRRHLRRLEEQAPVRFVDIATGTQAAIGVAEAAVALKRRWLADRGKVSPVVNNDRFARFFSAVAGADALRNCGTTMTLLMCGSDIAAVEIAFACKGRLAVHVIAYDKTFEKHGVGALLMEHSIRRAYDRGCHTYDLMAPGDAYKSEWTDTSIEVEDLALPLTLAGRGYARAWLGSVRPALKRAAEGAADLARRLSV